MSEIIKGVDISKWEDDPDTQVSINYSQMYHAGARFCFFRAGLGLYEDIIFKANYNLAKLGRLLTGSYWYLIWTVSIVDQIQAYMKLINTTQLHFSPCLDYEEKNGLTNRKDISGRLALAAHLLYDKYQVFPIIYTDPSMWQEWYSDDPIFTHCPLWIAHWGVKQPHIPKPWTDYLFWQYQVSINGADYGVESKEIDLNVFRHGYPELYRLAKMTYVPDEKLPPAQQLSKLIDIHRF